MNKIPRILKAKIIRGVAHPKGEDNSYNGFKLTEKQIFEKYKDLPGTIVYDDHDESKPIGKVIGATIGDKGELCMDAMLFEDNPNAQRVYERVVSGDYKGLSLGMDHLVDMEKGYVHKSDIYELSICPEGDMPGTVIRTIASKGNPSETENNDTRWFDFDQSKTHMEIQTDMQAQQQASKVFDWLNTYDPNARKTNTGNVYRIYKKSVCFFLQYLPLFNFEYMSFVLIFILKRYIIHCTLTSSY